ncbi:MAG: ABC transporter permease [Bacteroidales bacterium]|nr:ABC transporter permease [Bacteroidales bacterium]
MGVWHNIFAVTARELRIWKHRPIYLIGSIGVIAFCAIFFLTFFTDGLPSDLPIGIVDNDRSSLSRNFIQQLDATQIGKTVMYDDFEQARLAMQSGKITSICVIPEHMYADVSANRRPVFTYYLNSMYFVGGALAYKDILTMINLTNGAVQRQVLRAKGVNEREIMGRIRPIDVDTHQIGNVYTNYGYYLTNIILPAVLELVIIIVLIYSLGAEMKYEVSPELMRTAGGSILDAITGKLVLYTTLFTILGILIVTLLYHWMHFPIAGSIWYMIMAIFLMVLASEAIAIFIIGCLPVPRLALSIGALYSVLGFSLSGFTLPIEAMPAWIQGWSAAFPIRHYYLFYVQEVIFGAGFAGWWQEVVHLLLFVLLPLPILGRLKGAYVNLNFPKN